MKRGRQGSSTRSAPVVVRKEDTRALRRLARFLVKTGWRATRALLVRVPGGRRVVEQVVASRIKASERAERAKISRARERLYFQDLDVSSADPAAVSALVQEALGEAPADPHTTASVIAELAHAWGGDVKALYRRYQSDMLDAFLSRSETLHAPASQHPSVSILLILHNNAELTLPCLKSLQSETETPVEVIIVDNASSDRTPALLAAIKGARIVRNKENVGFLLAVNQAARLARGDHLLLLNNDATIRTGTLQAALDRVESDGSIGAVGARVVQLDGLLQEAGSIVWNDGTCLGYGRGDPEDAPHAMFVRDVDYCSGAFLLTPKNVWEELGGFDPAFAPAYYEDVDYCMRLWANGYRVVYEPKAVIDHFEFGSATKTSWAFSQQRKNRAVFADRHTGALHYQLEPALENVRLARSRTPTSALKVLMVDDRIPHRTLGRGYPRTSEIIEAIVSSGHELSFYPLQVPFEPWADVYETLPATVEAVMGYGVSGLDSFLDDNISAFDTLIVSRPSNMAILKSLLDKKPKLFSNLRIVYDAEAIFAKREITRVVAGGGRIQERRAKALIEDEIALAARADIITAVSKNEADLFRSVGQAPVEIIGHSLVPSPSKSSFAERSHIFFVGALVGDSSPNVDSVVWFVEEVLPKINEELGKHVTLTVAGKVESSRIERLRPGQITALGQIDDLSALYDASRVFIAPTRYAAGIPHKVHEAAAYGVPCVVSDLIARQLGWGRGDAVLVGQDAATFAEEVVRLYTDETLWHTIRRAGLRNIQHECDPIAFKNAVNRVLRHKT